MSLVDVTGIEIEMETNKNPCRTRTKSPLTKTRMRQEEKRSDNTNINTNANTNMGGRTIQKKRRRRRAIGSHISRCRARTTSITRHHHKSSAWLSTSRIASLIVFTALSATLVLFDNPTCIIIPRVLAVPLPEHDYSEDANVNTNPSNNNMNNNNNDDAKRAEAATERATAEEDKRKKEEKIEHYNNKNKDKLESNSAAYQRGRDSNHYVYHGEKDNSNDQPSRVVLTLAPLFESSLSYPVMIAGFGHDIDHTIYDYTAVIAKAPSDSANLCEIPDDLGTNSEDFPKVPVALLVSLGAGGCDVLTQASNALRVQQDISKNLKYILFYNNDPNDPETISTLSLGGYRVLAPITESPSDSPSATSTAPPSRTTSTLPPFTTSTLPPFTTKPTVTPSTTPTTLSTSFGTTPTTFYTRGGTLGPSSLYSDRFDKNETQTDDFYNEIIIDIDDEVDVDDINTGNEEGNDDGLQDFLLQLNQDRERKKDRQELEENDSMIFVSMSTSVGVQILAKIDEKVEDRTYTVNETQANPEFLAPGFSQWLMVRFVSFVCGSVDGRLPKIVCTR